MPCCTTPYDSATRLFELDVFLEGDLVQAVTLMRPQPTSAPTNAARLAPAAYFRQRVEAVVGANPWLGGKVQQVAGSKYLTWCHDAGRDAAQMVSVLPAPPEAAAALLAAEAAVDDPKTNPGSELPHEYVRRKLCTVVEKAHRALFSIVLMPLEQTTGGLEESLANQPYLCIVTMDHVLGDGYTFYSICKMLNTDGSIVSFDRQCTAALTADNPKNGHLFAPPGWAGGDSIYLSMLRRSVRSKAQAVVDALCPCRPALWRAKAGQLSNGLYVINTEKVAEAKAAAKEGPGGRWVSTNDVVTSWWWSVCPPSYGRSAVVNLRGRTHLHHARLAGNYVVSAVTTGDSSPQALRDALEGRHRKPLPPPSILQAMQGWRMVTNWCSLSSPLETSTHRQTFHMPLQNLLGVSYGAVVFNVREGVIGFLAGCDVCGEKLDIKTGSDSIALQKLMK